MLGLISLNYKIAPIQIRELFYLFPDQYSTVFDEVKHKTNIKGLFIISTCNRTEIYFETNDKNSLNKSFHSVLMTLSKLKKFNDGLRPYIKKKEGLKSIAKHIFRLASCLESMIVCEYQIVDQIKSAYKVCKKNKMLSPTIERMIQKSLEASKYIRTNSEIDKGGISVSSAAIDQLGNFTNSENLFILCVGAGRTSKLSIKQLFSKNFKNIYITNRTESNITPLLKKFNLKSVKFESWKKMLDSVDIIIFSTSSKTPLLTDDDLKNFDNQRKDKIILVDLSVPRNIVIEKTYEKIELVDLDKLKDKVNENYNKRISEVNKAQEMIEKFINDFVGWVDSRELRPTIISIKKEIKNLISGSSEKTKENKQIEDIYDKLSDKLVKKIISVSNNGKNADALKIINKIFVSDE